MHVLFVQTILMSFFIDHAAILIIKKGAFAPLSLSLSLLTDYSVCSLLASPLLLDLLVTMLAALLNSRSGIFL